MESISHGFDGTFSEQRSIYNAARRCHAGCPAPEKTVSIAAKGHLFGAEITENASCEKKGKRYQLCAVCQKEKLLQELPAWEHSFVLAESQASDCLHRGWELYCCERLGCTEEKHITLPIGKHSFGAKITEKATCEAAGRVYQVCSVCKATATSENFPATGHYFVKAEREESTCIKKGFQMYRCGNDGCTSTKKDVFPLSGHVYGPLITVAPTCETAGKNYRVCSTCKGMTDEREIAALGHAYTETNRVPSTCTKEGTAYFACERTGCSSKKTETLPLGDHQYGTQITRRTDCKLGAKVYRVCGDCGNEKLVDTLPSMAHDFIEESRTPSTCKTHGQVYLVCSRQGCAAKTRRELPLAEHDFRRKIEKPLCEQGGQVLNACSVCGKTELAEEIPALGHSFVLVGSEPSDCLHRGWELYRCERSGCTAEKHIMLPIGKHSFGAKITEKATCEAAGKVYQMCSVCKLTATLEKLPATGHYFVKAEREESTCIKKGFQMYRCGNDGCTSTKKDVFPFSPHVYGPLITVAPTCETAGKNYRVCSVCKGTTDEREIAALGHAYAETNRVPSTCTKEGTAYFSCERMGCSSKKTETLPLGDHNYETQIIQRTDCKLGAKVYRICGGCGDEKLVDTLPPMAHDFVEENRTPSTCKTHGHAYLVCSRQGCTAKTERELPLAEHDFRRKIEKPLCEQDGQIFNTCSVCGKTERAEEIPALGHSFVLVGSEPSDCLHRGWELYRCERLGCTAEKNITLPIGEHSFGAKITEKATCEAAGKVYQMCSVCKLTATLEKFPATGHYFVKAEREESTCIKKGFQLYRCGNDGCTSTKREVFPFSGHAYGPLITVAPTCETAGKNYRVCSVCKGMTDEREIAALGHAYAETNRVPSTCRKEGTAYFACERAGCSSKKTETLPLGDHQYGIPVTRRANCELGAKVYRICGGCGNEKLVDILPPMAHDFVEESRTPSTCKTYGQVYLVCSRQGCTAKTQRELPFAGHRLGRECTAHPTCEQQGEIYRLCGDCGEKQQMRVLEKLGHQYGKMIEETPTCTQEGRRYRVCERCGNEQHTETLKALGHSWGEWRPEEGFDCEKGGQYIRHCALCPASEQREETPKRHQSSRLRLLRTATCTEDGEMGTVCLACERITYSVAVKAPGHRFEAWTRPDSVSCAAGWQEQSACAACGTLGTRKIAAGAHQFAPWSVTRAASCTQKGERRHICTVCNLPETEEIPMRFHALSGPRIIRHPTCERAGETGLFCRDCDYVETYPLIALGHDWGKLSVPKGADCTAGWTGTRCCQRAGCTAEKPETIRPGDHRFGGWMIDTLPGCMKEGMKRHICDLCGAEQSEAVPAMGHRFGTPALITPPTCETEGESKLACTVCDYTETYPLAALRHDWRMLSITPATCTEKGRTEHQCSRCQSIKTEDILATGHQPGVWETVREASCGIEGQRKTVCLVCDEAMAEGIPALEHSFQPWGVTLPSACEKAGEEQRECARCGFLEKRAIAAGRHQLTLWTEEKPATCAGQGVYHRSCEVCDFKETMYTDAKPHTFGAWQKAEYTDCMQGGIQRRACGVCGQEEERPTERLNHWMGAWQTVQQAACEKEGIRERACKRCGVSETGSIAAKGHKAARKYTIVRKARAYHPGIREKLCVRCGTVLQKGQYSPSLQSMKVVFNPAGIPLKELLPGSTNQWYRLIPVDIRKQGVYTYPLVADGRHTVGDMTVTVGENALSVSCTYLDDRTVVFKPMLRVFSSLEEITPARIRRRVKGYALDKPISFSRFANADILYLYLRVEGVYDDRRTINAPFDAQSPAYLAQKEALLRMVPAR